MAFITMKTIMNVTFEANGHCTAIIVTLAKQDKLY